MSKEDKNIGEGEATSCERRDFLKKGAYAAPVILSLTATPAFAGCGSGRWDKKCEYKESNWTKKKKRKKRKKKKNKKKKKNNWG